MLPFFLASVAQAADALVLGVVPYLSARKLAELYEPLRAHLSSELSRPVVMESASDYTAYLARTGAGEYDIIATSPYFGRLAQREQGYVVLGRPLTDLEPLLVTRASGGPSDLAGLRGQVVTTSDRLANLTLAAHRHLFAHGLKPGVDLTIRPMGSHANSLAALEKGESAAAVVSVTALKQVGGNWSERVRVLARIAPTTPLFYLAHRRLGDAEIVRIRKLMFAFANETQEGRRFMDTLGHGGLKAVSEADMRALDPFVADLKTLLATP
ncbi:MAG: phosphate/phosphite/phosphonate ABC transporter substrate-binding protein [Betaproteobacteria bacterium]|nr:phosphate/phosphite/phosphonate ABC transporter substrate-binding protein [Betaproteobacteria bacterium]